MITLNLTEDQASIVYRVLTEQIHPSMVSSGEGDLLDEAIESLLVADPTLSEKWGRPYEDYDYDDDWDDGWVAHWGKAPAVEAKEEVYGEEGPLEQQMREQQAMALASVWPNERAMSDITGASMYWDDDDEYDYDHWKRYKRFNEECDRAHAPQDNVDENGNVLTAEQVADIDRRLEESLARLRGGNLASEGQV